MEGSLPYLSAAQRRFSKSAGLPIIIDGLREIASQYDVVILDKCGVLDDQCHPFRDAVEAVRTMSQEGKTVIIMGNAPITRSTMVENLHKVGIDVDPNCVWTSGEVFLRELQAKRVPPWSEKIAPAIFYRGKQPLWDAIMQAAPGTIRMDALKDADLMIIAEPSSVEDSCHCMDGLLYEGLALNIPMLCVNPDKTAMFGHEHNFYTPGMWAKRYQDIGGLVIKFYGKPYADIYRYVLQDLHNRGFSNRNRMLMIGDTLYTDIQGAYNVGIHSLWILHGSHRDWVLDAKGQADHEAIAHIMDDYKLFPHWIATGLRW